MSTADDNVASVRSTISRKKLAANRRNARSSTGPRSEEGKKISSRNAVTHAIFCRDLVVGEECEAELVALREGLQDALTPRDAHEHGLVDAVVAARWQLRRLRSAGQHLHDDAVAQTRAWGIDKMVLYRQQIQSELELAERRDYESIYQRAVERSERYEAATNGPLPVGWTIAQDLGRAGSGWERLSRYEQRLEQSIARSMRELRAYRKDLREFGRPEPTTDESEKAQNEPTAEESAASNGEAGSCDAPPGSFGAPVEPESIEESSGETPRPPNGEQTRDSDG